MTWGHRVMLNVRKQTMSSQFKWTFTDGWILMSVYFAHGQQGATLADLIAAADVMNHAIPTSGELTRALTRLAKCQIVAHVEGRFRISANYLPAIAEATEKKGGLFATPEKGKQWLSKTKFEIVDDARITISKKQVLTAFNEYRIAMEHG
jgi:hypothetical protein